MNKSQYRLPTFRFPEPDRIFLSTEQDSFLYKHLYGFSQRLKLQYRDVSDINDSPILILAENEPETVFLIAASFLLSIPILPLHPETTETELQKILEKAEPCAVFSTGKSKSSLLSDLPEISINRVMLKSEPENEFQQESFGDAASSAGLFLTSGSTGKPKMVVVKRRQVLFAAEASAENMKPGKNQYWLLCLPLNHVGGITVIYRSLLYGSGIHLRPDFEAEPIRKLLHENKSVMVASMVPTMLVELLEESFFRVHFDFKAILLGGGPISLELINRSITRGLPIVCSYGMTETCAQIAANPMLQPSGIYIPKNSVGPIFEPNRLQIRSDDGEVLPSNESGKIWLKGPQIFDGYLDEELSQMAFDDDGWFHTGDYGHLNRRGHLFIETRRSDLIITGGENVNPTEVEEQLRALETVIEAGVVGIPDKKWGQRVVAFITTSTREQPEEDQLREALKEHLRSFMIPKEFIVMDEIPRTSNGKIRRKELLEIYRKRE